MCEVILPMLDTTANTDTDTVPHYYPNPMAGFANETEYCILHYITTTTMRTTITMPRAVNITMIITKTLTLTMTITMDITISL